MWLWRRFVCADFLRLEPGFVQMERRERLKRLIAQRDGEVDLDLPTTDQLMVEEVAVQKVRPAGDGDGCWSCRRGEAACTTMLLPAAPLWWAIKPVR